MFKWLHKVTNALQKIVTNQIIIISLFTTLLQSYILYTIIYIIINRKQRRDVTLQNLESVVTFFDVTL